MTEADDPGGYQRKKVAKFKALVGIDELAGLDSTDGVLADWSLLTAPLSGELAPLRLISHDASPRKSGMGVADWDWKRRDEAIQVEIFVAGTGPAGARQRLIEYATDTTAVESQMALALEKVGELAVEHWSHEGDDILWVYRNICASVRNCGQGPKVIAIARRIQAFLAAHLVPHVASHVPKIAGIDVSKSPIRVGDTFEVRVRLPDDVEPHQLTIDVRPASWPLLDPIEYRESSVVFRATDPGPAELEIIVLDPVTLLSPKAAIVIDVLPAREPGR